MRIETGSSGRKALDYVERANRAIDHVLDHLAEPLALDDVARVAGFSPFHFHRVFRSVVGEPFGAFVKRLRLERALSHMTHAPHRPLTDVALECGFSSSSDFSRAFKKHYGVPPSAFDLERFRAERREEWLAAIADPVERNRLSELPAPGENPDGFEVELVSLPPRTVAYRRVLAPYRPGVVEDAARELVAWAEERGLADGSWLGYMWDDPDIVAHERCRYDVGLEVPADVRWRSGDAETAVGRYAFPAMTVARLELRGPIELEMRALEWLFHTWLPSSGRTPSAAPSFERWIGRPFAHGLEHFELFVELPVE